MGANGAAARSIVSALEAIATLELSAALTVSVNELLAGAPTLSITRMMMLAEAAAAAGVPVISPVEAASERPDGSGVPTSTLKVYGPVPPAAVIGVKALAG